MKTDLSELSGKASARVGNDVWKVNFVGWKRDDSFRKTKGTLFKRPAGAKNIPSVNGGEVTHVRIFRDKTKSAFVLELCAIEVRTARGRRQMDRPPPVRSSALVCAPTARLLTPDDM